METDILLSYLASKTDLTEPFKQELKDLLQIEIYKTHQVLHAAGQLENRLYFLHKGICRNYYYDQRGDEHTVKFWEPGDIIFSHEGYYHVASYYYTEIVDDTEVITLTYKDLHNLDDKFKEVAELIKIFLLSFQQYEYNRQQLLLLNAKERYSHYRKSNPTLFNKSPLRFIASYLGMTRETLTRLIGKINSAE